MQTETEKLLKKIAQLAYNALDGIENDKPDFTIGALNELLRLKDMNAWLR